MIEKQICSINKKTYWRTRITCNREIYDKESRLCIFHCTEKPLDEFREAFLQELEKAKESEEIKEFDCSYFVFPDKIDLSGLEFKKTNFENAKFGDEVNFTDAIFRDGATFDNTTFGDEAWFWGATFGDGTSFSKAIFGDRTSFTGATFKGETFFGYNECEKGKEWSINFIGLRIVNPKYFKLYYFNLEKVSLRITDWTDVEFLGCQWPMKRKRKIVYDEVRGLGADLAFIEQLYNSLQKNFENAKFYSYAGDFYIGAMEMRRSQIARRSNIAWSWIRQNVLSIMALYRLVSLYGERYIRPLWWLSAIILLFPLLYMQVGFNYFDQTTQGDPKQIEYTIVLDFNHLEKFYSDYKKGLAVSFHATTFQKNSKFFELYIAGTVIYILQSALSATIMTLFLLALRRKFGRK